MLPDSWEPENELLKPNMTGLDLNSHETNPESLYAELPFRFREQLGPLEQAQRYVISAVQDKNTAIENSDGWVYQNLIQPYLDELEDSLKRIFKDKPGLVRKNMEKIEPLFIHLLENSINSKPDEGENLITTGFFVSPKSVILTLHNEWVHKKQNHETTIQRIMDQIPPENYFIDRETGTHYFLFVIETGA